MAYVQWKKGFEGASLTSETISTHLNMVKREPLNLFEGAVAACLLSCIQANITEGSLRGKPLTISVQVSGGRLKIIVHHQHISDFSYFVGKAVGECYLLSECVKLSKQIDLRSDEHGFPEF